MPPENPIGIPFFELSEVDSTNNYAMQMVQAHLAEHGFTWFANYQNSRKGQRGKSWKAEPGQNITMSVLLQPKNISIDSQFSLNAAIALATQQFFNLYTISDTTIKWPNDLYWRDRKAGGILIENIIQGRDWKFAIVGIGININQSSFSDSLSNPVSLKQITGKDYDVIGLAKELCTFLQAWWSQLKVLSISRILAAYNELLYKKDQKVKLEIHGEILEVVIKEVNSLGELIVLHENDVLKLKTGNVKWLI